MSSLVYAILFAVSVIGWRVFMQGWRGVAIDNHPVCGKCRFDLTGRPEGSEKCPECGTRLSTYTIVVGNRRRREGMMCAGAAIALAGILPIFTGIGMSVVRVDVVRLEPLWWVLRQATGGVLSDQERYRGEILRRAKNNALSASGASAVAAVALGFQADLTNPWRPVWGDIVEAMQGNGCLLPADWQKYQSQDEPAKMEVRTNVARGDPIPYHFFGELRGGSVLNKVANSSFSLSGTVPGCATEDPGYSGGCGYGGFEFDGFVTLTAGSWDHLMPGPQQFVLNASGLASPFAKSPALFAPLQLRGTWALLPAGKASVQLFRDEAMAAKVQQTLSCSATVGRGASRDIWVNVAADHPPADFAFEVMLRSGSKEWKMPNWYILKKNSLGGSLTIFENAQELIGHRADVVLRPSIAGAAHTVQMDKLLDHEFVIKDVLIEGSR